MNDYQREQLEALIMTRTCLSGISHEKRSGFQEMIKDYLLFRAETASFLTRHFGRLCTRNCYENRMSACCSKDGIIAFFGDVVVNALLSSSGELDILEKSLRQPHSGFKCVWLSESGCLWRLKPVVCEMFLCDPAREEVFGENSFLRESWKKLEERKKLFTWPDRPVLFDRLEQIFLDAGYESSIMYLHNSPGLLRIKKLSERKTEDER